MSGISLGCPLEFKYLQWVWTMFSWSVLRSSGIQGRVSETWETLRLKKKHDSFSKWNATASPEIWKRLQTKTHIHTPVHLYSLCVTMQTRGWTRPDVFLTCNIFTQNPVRWQLSPLMFNELCWRPQWKFDEAQDTVCTHTHMGNATIYKYAQDTHTHVHRKSISSESVVADLSAAWKCSLQSNDK